MKNLNLYIIISLLVLVAVLATCNGCLRTENAALKGKAPQQVEKVKEVVRLDTVMFQKTDTFYKTKLQPFLVKQTDTLIEFLDRDVLVYQCLDSAFYLDSTLTDFGKIYIHDTIARNRIAGRSVHTAFTLPFVTKTITNTIAEKRTVKGFLTGSVQGSFHQPFQQVGAGFMIQFKNYSAIELQGIFNKDFALDWSRQPFQLSYKQFISFK